MRRRRIAVMRAEGKNRHEIAADLGITAEQVNHVEKNARRESRSGINSEHMLERHEEIVALAMKGATAAEIAHTVGVTQLRIQQYAPAARIRAAQRALAAVITSLEGIASGANAIPFLVIPEADAAAWTESLRVSLRALSRLHRRMKGNTQ